MYLKKKKKNHTGVFSPTMFHLQHVFQQAADVPISSKAAFTALKGLQ